MIKIEKFKSDRLIICAQFYDHVITDTPDMDKYGRCGNIPLQEQRVCVSWNAKLVCSK